jgi:D-beta-D-heptose 7-phosphate kinase/D-beta-D-heptose 1-phosphate adenosyltransferase
MSDNGGLLPLVGRLAGGLVLSVGDVMLDRFVSGVVERISPEAPIPVLKVEFETAMLGGAGNVARNVHGLTGAAHLVAVVGDDAAADDVAGLLDELAGAGHDLIRDLGCRTSIKTRFIASGQQMLRADRECARPPADRLGREIVDAVAAKLDACAVVTLSDYGKGALAHGVAGRIIEAAKKAGKPVIVDPKGEDYGRYRGADVITPNQKELAIAANMPTATAGEAEAAAGKLIADHGFGAVLVTRSKNGMILVTTEGATRLKAEAREVFDVSGAGDTVVAALAAALAAGAEIKDAAALANCAAGIVVGKVGTAALGREDLGLALRHRDITSAEAKIVDLESAVEAAEKWRRRGLTVGFTNGCFDLLHPGHVSLLNQAKKACDRLVVGLNSDASVRRLGKGDGRPVQGEAARATVLASLAAIDAVVVFGEDTPLAMIGKIRPGVLIKGADYALRDVVGADLVRGWGGRVILAELEPGHSTTETIKKISR